MGSLETLRGVSQRREPNPGYRYSDPLPSMHPEAVVAHGRGMGSHLEERLRTPVRKMGTRNTAVEAIGGCAGDPSQTNGRRAPCVREGGPSRWRSDQAEPDLTEPSSRITAQPNSVE